MPPPLAAPYATRVDAEILTHFCARALTAVGMSETDAQTTADILVQTDMCGIYTPGEMEWESEREARAHGVPLTQMTIDSLAGLASDLDLEPML